MCLSVFAKPSNPKARVKGGSSACFSLGVKSKRSKECKSFRSCPPGCCCSLCKGAKGATGATGPTGPTGATGGFGTIAGTTQLGPGSGTFVPIAGARTMKVRVYAAGGAGGGAIGTGANGAAGGGGGGGGYSEGWILGPFAPSYAYTVGAGGTGSSGTGTAGGDSWFSDPSFLFAGGGAGALGMTGSITLTSVIGAVGGIGSGSASLVAMKGGHGGNGIVIPGLPGLFSTTGGAGGIGGSGPGNTLWANTSQNGNVGFPFGSGGGGAVSNASDTPGTYLGGNGGDGRIIIESFF